MNKEDKTESTLEDVKDNLTRHQYTGKLTVEYFYKDGGIREVVYNYPRRIHK